MSAAPALRTQQGRFPKGVSGNPGGRPSTQKKVLAELATEVREQYDAKQLVEGMIAIANGESVNGLEPKLTDVLEARKWLADRGWGKAVDFKPQDEEDPLGLTDARERLVGKLASVTSLHESGAEGRVSARASASRNGT